MILLDEGRFAQLKAKVAAQSIRSQELKEKATLLIAKAKRLGERVEDLHKRTNALRVARQLAGSNQDYVLKKCGCGRQHSVPDWFKLPFVGYQEHEVMSGEMRNCDCESTLLFITSRKAA